MKRETRLYNAMFPLWLLLMFPAVWWVVLPANFLIDSAVLLVALRVMKQDGIVTHYRRSILWVWVIGFLSDFAGSALLLLTQMADNWLDGTALGAWWYENIVNTVGYNPFANVWGLLFVLLAVAVSGLLIYALNLRISFRRLELEPRVKRRLALALALLTAPWLFLFPTALLY